MPGVACLAPTENDVVDRVMPGEACLAPTGEVVVDRVMPGGNNIVNRMM